MRKLILGPPGTGKTTTLLNIVDDALAIGMDPRRIAFLSFTKAAAEEAIGRACDRFGLQPSDFPYFRTLHSLAYNMLGLRRSEVLTAGQYRTFAAEHGWELSAAYSEKNVFAGRNTIGDQLLNCHHLSTVRQVPLAQQHREGRYEFTLEQAEHFECSLAHFKRGMKIMDFNDFLSELTLQGDALPVDIFIVDEAQDLTAQQWALIEVLCADAANVYFAGDDDQAIYEWAGADVSRFLKLNVDQVEVLPKTWRLPRTVKEHADHITGQMSQRYAKEWTAGEAQGGISFQPLTSVDLAEGEWLVLARANYELKLLENYVRETGRMYSINGKHSHMEPAARAIVTYTRLCGENPRRPPQADLDNLHEFTEGRRKINPGIKWWDALTRLTRRDISYYRGALMRGESLTKPGQIRIATIHTTKGMEADNVLLKVNRRGMDDQELRVWYVAATRCRRNLYMNKEVI